MWVRQHNWFLLSQHDRHAAFLIGFVFVYRKLSPSDRLTQKDVVYQFAKLFSTYFARFEESSPETIIARNIKRVSYRMLTFDIIYLQTQEWFRRKILVLEFSTRPLEEQNSY